MDFKFLDLTGEEVLPGDTIVISALSGRSPRLFLGLVKEIKVTKAQARCYYKRIGEYNDRDTYVTIPIHWSGKASSEVMKISGVEFHLDQKRFAKLFAAKSEFEIVQGGSDGKL